MGFLPTIFHEYLSIAPLKPSKSSIVKGDQMGIFKGQMMENFPSPTLNKTFKKIFFASVVKMKDGGDSTKAATHTTKTAPKKITKIAPPKGGQTVAECLSHEKDWADKEVLVKGKVTKFNEAIMGKNWLHINDGSDEKGRDLVVTSKDKAQVGTIITIKGKIQYNKDIGSGYFFQAIVEDAQIISTKE